MAVQTGCIMSSAKYFGIPDCSKTKEELLELPLSLKSPLPIEHFTILLDYVELMLKMKVSLFLFNVAFFIFILFFLPSPPQFYPNVTLLAFYFFQDNLLDRLRFNTSTLDEKIIAWFLKRTHFKYIPTDKREFKEDYNRFVF